eukprot:m.28697 g.28697  ORF g.28697 m.28697 type:complete len:544 (+) comp9104_c0_seq1:1169-2800(+)
MRWRYLCSGTVLVTNISGDRVLTTLRGHLRCIAWRHGFTKNDISLSSTVRVGHLVIKAIHTLLTLPLTLRLVAGALGCGYHCGFLGCEDAVCLAEVFKASKRDQSGGFKGLCAVLLAEHSCPHLAEERWDQVFGNLNLCSTRLQGLHLFFDVELKVVEDSNVKRLEDMGAMWWEAKGDYSVSLEELEHALREVARVPIHKEDGIERSRLWASGSSACGFGGGLEWVADALHVRNEHISHVEMIRVVGGPAILSDLNPSAQRSALSHPLGHTLSFEQEHWRYRWAFSSDASKEGNVLLPLPTATHTLGRRRFLTKNALSPTCFAVDVELCLVEIENELCRDVFVLVQISKPGQMLRDHLLGTMPCALTRESRWSLLNEVWMVTLEPIPPILARPSGLVKRQLEVRVLAHKRSQRSRCSLSCHRKAPCREVEEALHENLLCGSGKSCRATDFTINQAKLFKVRGARLRKAEKEAAMVRESGPVNFVQARSCAYAGALRGDGWSCRIGCLRANQHHQSSPNDSAAVVLLPIFNLEYASLRSCLSKM